MSTTLPPKQRRPEIEGLRTFAALLVAVYHIWVGRVSGGVDVFFVVTGFFITLTLLKHIDAGRIRPMMYFGRLFRRLLPGAAVVLTAIGMMTILFAPVPLWRRNFEEIIASSISVENLYLAFNAIDYLNAEDPATPAQHFWAMSIQAQFYVFWLLLAWVTLMIVRRWSLRPRRVLMMIIIAVFVTSLLFSIVQTHTMQPFAYFVPWTRMWEFSVGGVLALLGSRVHLRGSWAAAVSWLSLIVLVLTGAVLPVEQGFPGVIAAVPVLAAAGILISTRDDERSWAGTRLLSLRPMVWLGSIAFGIYLWHWPLLMLYRYVYGLDGRPGLLAGVGIIVVSIILAYATKLLVEAPVAQGWQRGRTARGIIAAGLVTAWVVAVSVPVGTIAVERARVANADFADSSWSDSCTGAAALSTGIDECRDQLGQLPLVPDRAAVRGDIGTAYDCYTKRDDHVLRACESFGDPDGPRVGVIGSSHAAMLVPELANVAVDRGWSLTPLVGNGCIWLVSADDGTCGDRLQQQESLLLDDPFDLLFVLGGVQEDLDEYPIDHVHAQFDALERVGTTVVVLEDNPRLTEALTQCTREVSDDDLRDGACDMTEVNGYEYRDGYWEVAQARDGVVDIPTRDLYCADDRCPIVIGGVIAYRDRHHLTMTYVEEVFPIMLERIDERLSRVY